MQYKSVFLFAALLVFASACTKVETFYDCQSSIAPSLAQTNVSAPYGTIATNSANQNCFWIAPDGTTYQGNSVSIPLGTTDEFGAYKVFYYENGCSSDTATFSLTMSGTAAPPCSSQTDSWYTYQMNYQCGFQQINSTGIPVQYRYGSWVSSSFYMTVQLWTDTPQIGKVYFISTDVPVEDRAMLFGHGSNRDWTATSGAVYCTAAASDSSAVYFQFCSVPVSGSDTTVSTLSGKLYYLLQ